MDSVHSDLNTLTALIVDDEATNRIVLRKLLSRINYETVEATNGAEAVEKFKEVTPDIVFMDVMMPIMDGHEATRQIKELSKDDFVPVIFLTALVGGEESKKCIEAGGDDFLSKPFDMVALRSKILSMERIRQLYRHLRELNVKLEKDEQFARNVFSDAIFHKNEKISSIKTWFDTSRSFNNDLLLTTYTPLNGLNILFGHFNLQGTASAVGALPTSEVFRTMTQKGYAPLDIVEGINQKLYDLLPDDINLEAVFININQETNIMSYASFGIPNAYLLSTHDKDKVIALQNSALLLGQDKHLKSHPGFTNLAINKENTILLGKSSLIGEEEHCSISNSTFESFIEKALGTSNTLESLKQQLSTELKDSTHYLNTSLIEIPISESLTSEKNARDAAAKTLTTDVPVVFEDKDKLSFDLTIQRTHLKSIDPVPTLLNFLNSVTDIEDVQDSLFTVFTELYANALDHGVLGLDSDLKSSPEGFYNFFTEKENRLQSLDSGEIKIQLTLIKENFTNWLSITFNDSGPGFNYEKILSGEQTSKNAFSGRGYLLLKNLCDSIKFTHPGNCVTATVSWEQEA